MNIKKILQFLLNFYLMIGSECIDGFIPVIKASLGQIWPKPNHERRFENNFIDPNNFDFVVVGETCKILEEALLRYTRIIKESVKSPIIDTPDPVILFGSRLITKIAVNLTTFCESLPHLEMDESYKISGAEYLTANSIWGLLRALESYSQTIIPTVNGMLKVPNIWVIDSPRFPHRGLLLDTARHYFSIDTIFIILDGMAYNKLNVFHWHIVDDQSFPYQSVNFPELSEQGAYMPSMIYTQQNISNIIEYARMRGIRVVAEFDVPGHSRSWGNSHPEILTRLGCRNITNVGIFTRHCVGSDTGKLGPMFLDDKTYNFIQRFFSEVLSVFPDKYLHLGGDDVDQCGSILQNGFIKGITELLKNQCFSPIVWEEAMRENFGMPTETIIQVWMNDWRVSFKVFTNSGYRVLLSNCWYLVHDVNWDEYYKCEPRDFVATLEQKKLVIGGEACMWNEHVNNYNVVQRIFPRVSAVAERLWSTWLTKNITDAKKRLEEHTCRMILRGVHAEPASGPGIC